MTHVSLSLPIKLDLYEDVGDVLFIYLPLPLGQPAGALCGAMIYTFKKRETAIVLAPAATYSSITKLNEIKFSATSSGAGCVILMSLHYDRGVRASGITSAHSFIMERQIIRGHIL